jgi:RNA polymerase sigma factor (sigma-70 family)
MATGLTDAPKKGPYTAAPPEAVELPGLYARHFDGLFDFVARIARDRDLAADVVQTTFAVAFAELRAGRRVRHPRAWLYAIARNRALDVLRRRRHVVSSDVGSPEAFDAADPSRLADPDAVAEDRELAELVWSSAAALKPDEYSLLDMHVRQGLSVAEIAEALRLGRGAVHTRLSRLRSAVEEAVVSTLLVRGARSQCGEQC